MGELVPMLLVVAIGLGVLALVVMATVRGPLRRFRSASARLRGDVASHVATLQTLASIRRPRV